MRVGLANWSEHLWLGSWTSGELSSWVNSKNESKESPERDLRHLKRGQSPAQKTKVF